MAVRRSKNLWIAVIGFLCFWIGVGWGVIHEHFQKRLDPPGWIFDRAPYEPALMVSKVGLVVFLAASIVGVARLITASIFRLTRRAR